MRSSQFQRFADDAISQLSSARGFEAFRKSRENPTFTPEQEIEKRQMAMLERNSSIDNALAVDTFNMQKKAAETAADTEYYRKKNVFDVAAGNMKPEQYAGLYDKSGVGNIAYQENANNRNSENFWKLAAMQNGMDLSGRMPRNNGSSQELSDAGGNGSSKLATLLSNNEETTPGFDIDKTLEQVNRMNAGLYGMNKPQQTNFTVGRGGQQFNVDTSGSKANWTQMPINDGGVSSARYMGLAESNQKSNSARQALLTPPVNTKLPTGDSMVQTPDFNTDTGFTTVDKSKYPESPLKTFQKKQKEQDYRSFNQY